MLDILHNNEHQPDRIHLSRVRSNTSSYSIHNHSRREQCLGVCRDIVHSRLADKTGIHLNLNGCCHMNGKQHDELSSYDVATAMQVVVQCKNDRTFARTKKNKSEKVLPVFSTTQVPTTSPAQSIRYLEKKAPTPTSHLVKLIISIYCVCDVLF
jgi:hypothetical protein